MRGAIARGGWVPVLIAAITAAFFWKILLLGRAIGGLDVLEYFYPYRVYARQAIDNGRLPLWNPDIFGGAPFLANIQAGLFYPPTALFYVLPFPAAYTWSVVLHAFLGGLFAYLLARQSLGTSRLAGLIGALTFAFGGFLGGQMGHLNQLSAAIWLPALLLCWDKAVSGRLLYVLLGAGAVALQFLAGHTQESYLMLVALLLYAAYHTLLNLRRYGVAVLVVNGLVTVVLLAVGAALAAVQLVPTAELTSWSIRANGLSYQEATTFSLKGTTLLNAILPPFWNRAFVLEPGATEFLGYVSVTGLVLAVAALIYARRRQTYFFLGLAALAFFLALGQQNPLYPVLFRFLPGLNLFRVPARWLFLSGFSTAMLAAVGADALLSPGIKRGWRPMAAVSLLLALVGVATAHFESLPPVATRLTWAAFGAVALALAFAALLLVERGAGAGVVQGWREQLANRVAADYARARTGLGVALVALMFLELWLAAQSLDYNHPTAPRLFDQSIGTVDFLHAQPPGFRVLSVAQDTFAPAIEATARQQLGAWLGDQDLLAYLSYYKLREILEPNTSMAAGIATIDGYDGGLLPLARYVSFKNLLTERQSAPDDRIRFVVKWLPNRPLLDVSGVGYVVTDAIGDKSIDGVKYDLSSFVHLDAAHAQVTMRLGAAHTAGSVGVIVAAKSAAPLSTDAVVATLRLTDAQGKTIDVPVRAAGSDQGQLAYSEPLDTHASIAKLPAPMAVNAASVTLQPGVATDVFLAGLAFIDGASGGSYSPLVAPGPELTRVYQGDVKVYQNPAAAAPAFLVHDAQLAQDAEEATAAMGPGFDGMARAIVEPDPQPPATRSLLGRVVSKLRRSLPGQTQPFSVPDTWLDSQPANVGAPPDRLSFDDFRPEHVVVRSDSDRAGFLVLTQSFYPGWEVTVDGAPAHLFAADMLFQAVHLPAGQHRVEFAFKPRSLLAGAAISLAAVVVCLAGLLLAWRPRPARRRRQAPA
jgi:hypothetical protein